jgi:hypothetical protein
MNTTSLRFRLSAWHAGLLTAVFVLLGSLLYLQLKNYLEVTLLDTQARRAEQIGDTLLLNLPTPNGEQLTREIGLLYAPERSDRFIRVTRNDGIPL